MKPDSAHHRFPGIAALAIFVGAGWLAGCQPSSSTVQPLQEVRGVPIRPVAAKSEPSSLSNPTQTNVAAAAQAPAVVATPAVPPAAQPAPALPNDKPVALGFDQLSGYTFEVTDELLGPVTNDVALAAEKTNAKIPAPVKSFDQKKVALRGFMLPLKVEGGLVTEMLIMKDQSMCCYGTAPRINDWVSVRMKGKGVRATMDLPVTLFGTMRVGEMRENGYLVGIYSMDGEEMAAPEAK